MDLIRWWESGVVGKWGDVIPLFDGERDQGGRLIENWNS